MMAPCEQMLKILSAAAYVLLTQYFMKITVTLPEHYKDVMFRKILLF